MTFVKDQDYNFNPNHHHLKNQYHNPSYYQSNPVV